MVATMQKRQIAWSALLAALLIGLALITDHIEWFILGSVTTIITLLLAGRVDHKMMWAMGGATLLVAVQALLPPLFRWGNGLLLIAVLLTTAFMAWLGHDTPNQQGNRQFRQLSIFTLLLAYLSTQVSFLARLGSELMASDTRLFFSQAESIVVLVLGLAIFLQVRRAVARQHQPLVRRLAVFNALAYSFYVALVFSPLWSLESASTATLLAISAIIWALSVAIVVAVIRLPNKPNVATMTKGKKAIPAWRVTLNDYLTLMKYRVASLLLLTTLGGMVVAAQGWPGWSLVGWVMLGGLLSVGGAGALNHYLDRDLDINMGRTSRRPIPSGRIAPWKAVVFGLVLSVAQFAIFWFKVNSLSAWLSLAGLLYYVLIYTVLLKRTTTQNIVIGGAAGAFPPLVGWAAVTGDLSLGAWYLFAVIFYWTPPHFWALALMRKKDYARAGVPMLPVVMGEKETRRQIVLYTLLMIAITVMMVPLRLMGFLYLAAAILLNAKFLWDAIKLYRQPSNQAALSLYKYSLLYLALLFVAMAVDRAWMA